jgi:putative NADH-flavin reductase
MNMQRVVVLGATGGNGRAFIEQALGRGHKVTAFVRSPEKLAALQGQVTVRKGDPCSVPELTAALQDQDAVVSSLGPPNLGRTTIIRDAARSTVAAMNAAGVRRLLIVSAGLLFDDAGVLAMILRRTLLHNAAEDCAAMEGIVQSSRLDWSIVRPPRLTNGKLTRHYRVESGHWPRGGRRAVSRADIGHYLVNELERGAHVWQIVGMAGGLA